MQAALTLDELIRSHPFLAGLEPKFVSLYETCASLRRFSSHQRIFLEGEEADHFYLILSGKVILETSVDGGGCIPIQTLGGGEALGWSWLFPPHQWCFTACTAAPTEALSFAAQPLRQKAQESLEFGNDLLRRVTRTLIQRLQVTRRALVQLYASTGAGEGS